MKYLDNEDVKYTAAGIVVIVSYLLFFWFLSLFGWFGWFLNMIGIMGLGAILGDFIHTWHIDKKFEMELEKVNDEVREKFKAWKMPDDPSA